MHVAAVVEINSNLVPAMQELHAAFLEKQKSFENIIKIGRTHLQDATPLTLGQEFSGYVTQVERGIERVKGTIKHLSMLAQGGTAVGTVRRDSLLSPDFSPYSPGILVPSINSRLLSHLPK